MVISKAHRNATHATHWLYLTTDHEINCAMLQFYDGALSILFSIITNCPNKKRFPQTYFLIINTGALTY